MHLSEADKIAGAALRVGIGRCKVGRPPERLRATLGSCIGICIHWPKERLFGLAHILLPYAVADELIPRRDRSRYVITAIPHLVEKMNIPERKHRELRAYMAGGAMMFGTGSSAVMVGERNLLAARKTLKEHRIKLLCEDVGGTSGRQIVVDGCGGHVFSIRLDEDDGVERWNLTPTIKERRNL